MCVTQWTEGEPTESNRTPTLLQIGALSQRMAALPGSLPKREPQPADVLPMPAIPQMLGNFATAIMGWISGGCKVVDESTFRARLGVCRGCQYWSEDARAGLGKCGHPQCGCTRFKMHLATEKCPLGLWS